MNYSVLQKEEYIYSWMREFPTWKLLTTRSVSCINFPSQLIPQFGGLLCYADDTQFYVSVKPNNSIKLSLTKTPVENWMSHHFLLNSDKTVIVLIRPRTSTDNFLQLSGPLSNHPLEIWCHIWSSQIYSVVQSGFGTYHLHFHLSLS